MSTMEEFISEQADNPVGAILAIAERHGIGIAYVDRDTVEVKLASAGHPRLSDQEWAQVKPHLAGVRYDEYLGVNDTETDFLRHALRRAQIKRDL
ncbi:hypothetical protein [Streptomyces cucumeris]|uniref:hypothetical protein n=1 Tax=Streptomyces cucumeris TaxID=2962890 RepID=UPI0020C86079|nr:hypothetical protein [Streptomyces sp. NEAU-Y11]MCP9209578.1 hypothetical protein [Streptomyces sp. NEAU-Y11]